MSCQQTAQASSSVDILRLTLGSMRLQPLPEDCLCLSRIHTGVPPPLAAAGACRGNSTSQEDDASLQYEVQTGYRSPFSPAVLCTSVAVTAAAAKCLIATGVSLHLRAASRAGCCCLMRALSRACMGDPAQASF